MSVMKPNRETNILQQFGSALITPQFNTKIPYEHVLTLIQIKIIEARGMGFSEAADELISHFLTSIPEKMYDEEFAEDLQNAMRRREELVVEMWCGTACGEATLEVSYETEKSLVYQACINLLDRHQLLLKEIKSEVVPGTEYGKEDILFQEDETEK